MPVMVSTHTHVGHACCSCTAGTNQLGTTRRCMQKHHALAGVQVKEHQPAVCHRQCLLHPPTSGPAQCHLSTVRPGKRLLYYSKLLKPQTWAQLTAWHAWKAPFSAGHAAACRTSRCTNSSIDQNGQTGPSKAPNFKHGYPPSLDCQCFPCSCLPGTTPTHNQSPTLCYNSRTLCKDSILPLNSRG